MWTAVSTVMYDYTEYRMDLEVISKAVPMDVMGTIARKASAKAAWDSITLCNFGVVRVRKTKAGSLKR
jgi:hypothetical protein